MRKSITSAQDVRGASLAIAASRAKARRPGYHAHKVKFLRAILLALMALAALAPGLAFPAAATPTDRVIVKWREASSATRIGEDKVAALAERRGRRLAAGRVIGGGMSVVKLDRERAGADLDAVIADLRNDPAVESVVPDRRVRALAYTPNDPLFSTGQWYLKSTEVAAIRADAAWDVTRGGVTPATSLVIVAVLDTGIRASHP